MMKSWQAQLPPALPILSVGPDEEVVKSLERVFIKASALNHRDVWITKGLYPSIVQGATMGSDGVGEWNGEEVIIFPSIEWGDRQSHQSNDFRVLGVPDHGTFASHIDIDRSYIFPKPKHLSSIEAAALPLAGLTAYRALISRAQIKATDKVLISGIGGGVALFASQFAIALGCEVYVTSSDPSKIDKALTLGAKAGFLYTDPKWVDQCIAQTGGGIDVVIDGACGDGFNDFIKIANPGARIAFYGATRGNINNINARAIFWKQISLLGSTMGSRLDFLGMIDFVEKYEIKPIIDSVFDFNDLHLALQRMENGDQFGKIVIDHSSL